MPEFSLTPRLVVKGAAKALDFYRDALGAEVIERFADDSRGGIIVHSAIKIGATIVAVVDEYPEWGMAGPEHLGGSPVLLHITVDDPDATAARMQAHGAEIVIPIADQFYGRREGRVRDPFGHLWIPSKEVEKLEPGEIQRRMNS